MYLKASGALLALSRKLPLEKLQQYFTEHRVPVLQDFQETIENLCRKAYQLQLKEQKEPIKFFSFSYLRRCVYTQKYEVRLDLYNKDFYFGPLKVHGCWDMQFIFQFFQMDMEYFKEHIGNYYRPTGLPLREYEIKEFALWYIRHYYKIAEKFFRDQIPTIVKNEGFHLLKQTDRVQFLSGGYMEEQRVLLQMENKESGTE